MATKLAPKHAAAPVPAVGADLARRLLYDMMLIRRF